MKSFTLILCLFFLPAQSFCQYEQSAAIAETMSNTFNLYGDKLSGSCFMIIKNEKQYFVTAAHLFDASHKSGDVVAIQMLIQNQLQSFNASVYFHADRKVDIAVFSLPEKVSQNIELPEEFNKYKETLKTIFHGNGISMDTSFTAIGMDVFFFGFPLGNLGTEVFGIKFPLVKKAIVSGFVKHNGLDLLVLDGHNNLGFSGGPVAAYNTTSKTMSVVGVISGYVPEPVEGQYKKEKILVTGNSGVIICYGKPYIEDIFTKNKKELH